MSSFIVCISFLIKIYSSYGGPVDGEKTLGGGAERANKSNKIT